MSAYHNEKNLKPQTAEAAANAQGQSGQQSQEEAPIPINGFAQVLDMLRVADPVFRESLLKRIGARDARLARQLRDDLDGTV